MAKKSPTSPVKECTEAKEKRRFSLDALKHPALSLVNSIQRRRKSEFPKNIEGNTHNNSLDILEENEEEDEEDKKEDEEEHDPYNLNSEINLSYDLWFFGELDILLDDANNANSNYTTKLLVLVDKDGKIYHQLYSSLNDGSIVSEIPSHEGEYCLNFCDPTQPRFKNLRLLLAHLIKENYLQRVSYEWLIKNFQQEIGTSLNGKTNTTNEGY